MKTYIILVVVCGLVVKADPQSLLQILQAKNAEHLKGLPGFLNIGQSPIIQNQQEIRQNPVYQNTRQDQVNQRQPQYNEQQLQSQYQPQPQNQYQAQSQNQYQPQPQSQYQAQPQNQYQPQPQSQYQAQPQTQYQPQPQSQYQAQPQNQYNQQQEQNYQGKRQNSNNDQNQQFLQQDLSQTSEDIQSAAQVIQGSRKKANTHSVVPLPNRSGSGQNIPLSSVSNNPLLVQNRYGQNNENTQLSASGQPLFNTNDALPLANLNLNAKELSSAISKFGLKFMNNVGRSSQNLVFSPLSIATALALLQQGAKGETQTELTNVLYMTPSVSATAYGKLTKNIQQRTSSRNTLELANNLFVSDTFTVNIDYKRQAIKNFASEITTTVFSKGNDTVNFINSWVAAKTHNKIKQLVTKEDIKESTKLLLGNVVYFKGTWEKKFNPTSTEHKEFTLGNGETKMVPFMRMRHVFKAGIDPVHKHQVISIPFDGKLYSLIVILPPANSDTTTTLSTLTTQSFADFNDMQVKEVFLEIPKFTAKSELDLAPVLKKLGVQTIFSQFADLTALGTYLTYSPTVSSALHSAVLSIDENGGTAAAATGFAAVALSYDENSMDFKVDRPFIAVLWDHKAEMPLFITKIEDPSP